MDGDEGGGAVGKMQGLVVTIEIVLLSAATAPLPPAKPQQSPLVRYFGPGRATSAPPQRPACATTATAPSRTLDGYPPRFSSSAFQQPQRLTRLRHRRLGSTIRAIPRLGLQGAQPLNQLTALGPPRVRDAGPVLGGLDPHPALP